MESIPGGVSGLPERPRGCFDCDVTSDASAQQPENKDSVFGRGFIVFLSLAGGLFAVIAIAIPMVIIASSVTDSGSAGAAPPVTEEGRHPGELLAGSAGCLACHTTDGGESVGPTWLGLAGSDRSLESGETVVADDAYLRESIVDPAAKIVEGFAAVMPAGYEDQLSAEEIDQLISYINDLG